MGTSYIQYGDTGFWTSDANLELWLFFTSDAIASDSPAWLQHAREDWRLHATGGFTGMVDPHLDEHLASDADREAVFLSLIEEVRVRVSDYGAVIPPEETNSFGTGGSGCFTRNVSTDLLLRLSDAITGLVRGEVAWDPTPPPGVWPQPQDGRDLNPRHL